MIVLAAGVALVAILIWLGWGATVSGSRLRLASALFAAIAAVGAVVAGLRGGWPESLVLIGLSAYLGQAAGKQRPGRPRAGPANAMTPRTARAVLGLAEGASSAEIEDAYRRLMRRVHPDHGGSTGLAAQINAARDCLLGRP